MYKNLLCIIPILTLSSCISLKQLRDKFVDKIDLSVSMEYVTDQNEIYEIFKADNIEEHILGRSEAKIALLQRDSYVS